MLANVSTVLARLLSNNTMESILAEAAKQVPALSLMVVVIWLFMRHLAERDRESRETYKELISEHIDARAQSRIVIQHNTEAMQQGAEIRSELANVLKEVKERL